MYNRLHNGCPRLTHSYITDHTDPAKCTNCHQLLSVKHIPTECSSGDQSRKQYYILQRYNQSFPINISLKMSTYMTNSNS